jgi:hypothetical protein
MNRSYSPIAGEPSANPTSRMQSAWLIQVWVHGEFTFVSGKLWLANLCQCIFLETKEVREIAGQEKIRVAKF